ncbi:MAG: hypothetical protein ACLVBP_16260 [Ruminococcus sp.]
MENNNTATQNPDTQQTAAQSNQQSTPAIDYGKIQQMLDGTLAAKEDTALESLPVQQGLSQQEVEQAITAFKEQKAANQPDVIGMQNQITETQAQLATSQKSCSGGTGGICSHNDGSFPGNRSKDNSIYP